ncbi:hypothetical protein Tco_1227949 [Tanacetum coccineum]
MRIRIEWLNNLKKESFRLRRIAKKVLKNQRVSRISAAAEKRIPVKIVREIRAMKREWRAGIGPNGTGRRLGRRKRWRMSDRRMYVKIEVNRNDQGHRADSR